jgi:signal peptidase
MSKKAKKIIDITVKVVWWIVLVSLAGLVINIVSAKVQGKVPKVFGYSVVLIISPSMGETIPVGTYILIQETAPEDVKEENIICFYSEDLSIYGHPNTHRVVEVIEKDGKYEYVTRGDGNLKDDNVTAKGDKLIGRYVKNLDALTWLSEAVYSKGMVFVCVGMFVLSAGAIVAIGVLKSKDDKEQ